MADYLFPVSHPATPEPFTRFTCEFMPSARKSVLIVDPHPEPDLIRDVLDRLDSAASCRILLRYNPANRIPDLRNTAIYNEFADRLRERGIKVRSMIDLSARIYIADDTAMVISGDTGGHFGVVLPGFDSQPVIEYWESCWKSARKYSPGEPRKLQVEILKQIQSGNIPPEEFVHVLNRHGYFIDVHIHFFKGYQRVTVKPIGGSLPDAEASCSIGWLMVASRHYRAFARESSRIRSLKLKPYLIRTPVGPFLLKTDYPNWQAEFEERRDALRLAVGNYLTRHYKSIRQEAFSNLETGLERLFNRLSRIPQLLPLPSREGFVGKHLKEYSAQFPDRRQLLDSCSCDVSRFGLHPDTLQDQSLMSVLSRIPFQPDLM
ncbi:hypothetical protein JXA40_10795 [bacterium]|nr:hypothetical protein [candidate division CSSED10-310 bacterium]